MIIMIIIIIIPLHSRLLGHTYVRRYQLADLQFDWLIDYQLVAY